MNLKTHVKKSIIFVMQTNMHGKEFFLDPEITFKDIIVSVLNWVQSHRVPCHRNFFGTRLDRVMNITGTVISIIVGVNIVSRIA